jgi:4-amino-4-deoxy-L-arabinose transferase-like glycosyltransferase
MSAPRSPSGEAPPWGLIGLVAGLLAIRLVLAAALPLTEDEAYYRLWARAPALGYYDHPPMVAWWVWAGVRLVGDTPLGVRLAACLASALTSLVVFDLARLAGGTGADGERAGLWWNAMPLVAAGGLLAVPDASATLFWTLTLWAALRALRDGSPAWWLGAGLAAGFAAISKYSALFLGPGVLIWLCLTPRGRESLRTPGPWLALAAAAALFGLNLAWNATHHWLTFAKQFGRIAPHALAPRYLAEFLATELLLINPFLAAFLLKPGRAAPMTPFLATGAPFIAYLLFHSLHDRIQAHWPAPVYPALALCAAFAARGATGVWRVLAGAVPFFGFGACVAAAIYMALPIAGVPIAFDPALPLRGWPVFSRSVEALRLRNQAAWIGTTSYGLAAQFMDQPQIAAPVLQISERQRWAGLRDGSAADTAKPGLLVDLQRRIDVAALSRCFAEVRPLGGLDRGVTGETAKRYAVVLIARPRRDVMREGCGAPPP